MDNKCQSFPSELSRWVSGNQEDVGGGVKHSLHLGRVVQKLSFEALEPWGGLGMGPQASSSGKKGTIALSTCGFLSLSSEGQARPSYLHSAQMLSGLVSFPPWSRAASAIPASAQSSLLSFCVTSCPLLSLCVLPLFLPQIKPSVFSSFAQHHCVMLFQGFLFSNWSP